MSNYVEWKAIVVGDECPQKFNQKIHGFHKGGWTSSYGTEYPIDIVIGLQNEVYLHKIELTARDKLAPKEVEVRVGKNSFEVINYRNAKHSKFSYAGNIEFHRASGASSSPLEIGYRKKFQTQFLYFNNDRWKYRYIWLIVHEPFPGDHNPDNQINLLQLNVYGATVKIAEENGKKKNQMRRKSELLTSNITKMSTHSESYNKFDPKLQSSSFSDYQKPSLETVKDLLKRKRRIAIKDGRSFEATICGRALQQIHDYEWKLLEIRGKFASAIANNDRESAERYSASMDHYRDTFFRSIHLDLLLS